MLLRLGFRVFRGKGDWVRVLSGYKGTYYQGFRVFRVSG